MRLRVAAACAVAALGSLLVTPVTAHADTSGDLAVVVTSVSTPAPARLAAPQRISFRIRLTNTGDQTLRTISLDAERGGPITTQDVLDDALRAPAPADPGQSQAIAQVPVRGALAPGAQVDVTVATTLGIPTSSGICQCHDGVYPIGFAASALVGSALVATPVGYGQTYLPTFLEAPQPVTVTWVWPLLDRPHRAVSDDIFLDDDLAAEVHAGGRLDRALQVLERIGRAPVTVVLDPELVDELAVMQTGYRVSTAGGGTATGRGGADAGAWLTRLRAVLGHGQVSLTLPADPDVDSLARRGRDPLRELDGAARARVSRALGADLPTTLLWPVDGSLGDAGLAVADGRLGTRTLVLDDRLVPEDTHPDAPVTLPGHRAVTVLLTDDALDAQAAAALGPAGAEHLPALLAELAVRAAEQPDVGHFAVLTAPRYVDPDPDEAARALVTTTTTSWTHGATVADAARTVPARTASSATEPIDPAGLPSANLDAISTADQDLVGVSDALDDKDRTALLGPYPVALQRLASSAWRTYPDFGSLLAAAVVAQAAQVRTGVTIERPSQGAYTLASDDSFLFVTAVNRLPFPVSVRLSMSTVGGIPGFRVDEAPAQTIPAAGRYTFRLKAHVQRAGRFQVQADLTSARAGRPLDSVQVGVRSSALGTVGVIITTVASLVLALALIVRIALRLRARRLRVGAA